MHIFLFYSSKSHQEALDLIVVVMIDADIQVPIDNGGGEDEADDEVDWQPHVTINAKVLVFSHGCFPSEVAYLTEDRSNIFWDLGFLQDRFARVSDAADRASNFLRKFKSLAYSHQLVENLHLRGRIPRMGLWKMNNMLCYLAC